jgi:hypothetical protein
MLAHHAPLSPPEHLSSLGPDGMRIRQANLFARGSDITQRIAQLRVGQRANGGLSCPQAATYMHVLDRQYDPWDSQRLVVDTANDSVEHVLETIIRSLSTIYLCHLRLSESP